MAWSTKKRRGRPKVQRTPFDYGNDRVQARAELFRVFGGEKSRGTEMTCAGRLMLVGAFDGMEQEPAAYLAALLTYSDAYWSYYGGGPQIASYERSDRSHDNRWEDPKGEWFQAMDARLRDAGYEAYRAVQQVSTDRHWFPDEDAGYAARIIAEKMLQKGVVPAFATLPSEADWEMLELLKLGVRALVEPQMRRAA
jgi:hypothetical protein